MDRSWSSIPAYYPEMASDKGIIPVPCCERPGQSLREDKSQYKAQGDLPKFGTLSGEPRLRRQQRDWEGSTILRKRISRLAFPNCLSTTEKLKNLTRNLDNEVESPEEQYRSDIDRKPCEPACSAFSYSCPRTLA
jgi:hypothetical protein